MSIPPQDNPLFTEDPNHFGEQLRSYCFLEEVGCYHCFDLQKEFSHVSPSDWVLKEVFTAYDPEEWARKAWEQEKERVACYVWLEKDILVAWYWDGDGRLLIRAGNKAALNTDCKKNNTWEWVDCPPT